MPVRASRAARRRRENARIPSLRSVLILPMCIAMRALVFRSAMSAAAPAAETGVA